MDPKPSIRKVPAASVPYGVDICERGNHVWAAFDDAGKVVAVGATKRECLNKVGRVDKGKGIGEPPAEDAPRIRVRRWNEGRQGEVLTKQRGNKMR